MADIQHLRYFLKVSQQLNYTKAAEELYISRQAVAQAVRQLETEFHKPLFERHKNTLSLTPLGEIVRMEAEKLVGSFDHFEAAVKKYANGTQNELQVSMGPGIIMNLSADLFTRFSRSYPTIFLSTEETDNQAIIRHVQSGETDVGLIGSSPAFLTRFDSQLIRKSDLHICVNVKHPLARKTSLTIQDLKQVPIVGFGSRYDLHRFFVTKCQEAGFYPTFSILTVDMDIAGKLVMENRSVCFGLPDYTTEKKPDPERIKVLPLVLDEPDEWGIYAITRRDHERTLPQQLFIDTLIQAELKSRQAG